MPSEKVLEAKKAQVAETVEILKAAQTGVLVDYRGLNVEEDTELRRKLREANVTKVSACSGFVIFMAFPCRMS